MTVTVLSPEGEIVMRMEFSDRETISIGRSSESDICLNDFGSRISRCHGVIMHDGQNWEYYNLGVNGTFENGRQVDSMVLGNSALVRLARGGPILRFRIETLATAPAPLATVPDTTADSGTELDPLDVTGWIRRVRAGDDSAAMMLWQRYSDHILEIARKSLGDSPRRVHDEEDVALMAFKSLLAGLREGRFKDLDAREQLWRLLIVITSRKAAVLIESSSRLKRGAGEVRGDSAMLDAEPEPGRRSSFDDLPSENPTPDIALILADQTRRLLELLPDDISRRLFQLKLEGYSHEEIATALDCNTRTVERRLKQIREIWQQEIEG